MSLRRNINCVVLFSANRYSPSCVQVGLDLLCCLLASPRLACADLRAVRWRCAVPGRARPDVAAAAALRASPSSLTRLAMDASTLTDGEMPSTSHPSVVAVHPRVFGQQVTSSWARAIAIAVPLDALWFPLVRVPPAATAAADAAAFCGLRQLRLHVRLHTFDHGVAALAALPALRDLEISGCEDERSPHSSAATHATPGLDCTDACLWRSTHGLRTLALRAPHGAAPQLTRLCIIGMLAPPEETGFHDDDKPGWPGLVELRELELRQTPYIGDVYLWHLKRSCPKLRALRLTGVRQVPSRRQQCRNFDPS
jgi:hypothetical protein